MRQPKAEGEWAPAEDARAILKRCLRRLTDAFLSPECHAQMRAHIEGQIAFLRGLEFEATLRRRSPEYRLFCKKLMNEVAESSLGPLEHLSPSELASFEGMLDACVGQLIGKPVPAQTVDPAAYVAFQRRIMVSPRKRGPRYRPSYDVAFQRLLEGKDITSIARELEPEAYENDPIGTVQRYSKALSRRRRKPRT